MEATRQIFWNINGKGIMYVFALIAIAIFIVGFCQKILNWQQGRPIHYDNLGLRLKKLITDVIKHDKGVFKGSFRRFMHLGVFYGFIIMMIGTLIIAIQVDFNIPLLYGKFYLIISLLLDLFGLMALIGIVMAAHRRYIYKRDHSDYTLDDALLLILVFLILLTGFILEGLRISIIRDSWASWTPVGLFFSMIIEKAGLSVITAQAIHAYLWYLHMLLAFGFIAYIPYSKLFHMFASPLNIFLSSFSNIGTLTTLEKTYQETKNLGVTKLEDFSKKQLIELDACISCLRCQKGCPAEGGDASSPRVMIQSLKKHSKEKNSFFRNKGKTFDYPLIDKVIPKETLWSCTTCGLCEDKCPVNIEHIKRIVGLRRSLINVNGYPNEVQELFRNTSKVGNPWGLSLDSKYYLAKDLKVPLLSEKKQTDILYWVGCFGSYESRTMNVSLAMFKILQKASIDYAIMGIEEKCCGDSVRRLGNERLFQQLALENINHLNNYKFKTIVTHCPHCYNTLKNEYPQFGGHYQVLHHSQFILELIQSGRIVPKAMNKTKVTFHDPCYLGRYNNIYDAPREVLSAIPGLELLEMKNNRAKAFCCGGGGGCFWMEDKKEQKINIILAKEAIKNEFDILASACSFCLTQLTKAVSSLDVDMKSLDIAEIISDNL